tara:strand:- start:65 stop:466 length:402 start_codon:yes stop_codon:yes gene_type:complete
MTVVKFKVSKEGVSKEIEISNDSTIENLKGTIKSEFSIHNYIDIDFTIDKPMRVLGKFNVEPGILPRTFDRYELDKFGIKDEIALTFHEVLDYTPFTKVKKEINLKRYSKDKEDTKETPKFNINSEDDFPKLG